jgi:hypothetical protein
VAALSNFASMMEKQKVSAREVQFPPLPAKNKLIMEENNEK